MAAVWKKNAAGKLILESAVKMVAVVRQEGARSVA